MKERLINEGAQLTLEKVLQIAQNFEYLQQQLEQWGDQEQIIISKDVNAVTHGRPNSRRHSRSQIYSTVAQEMNSHRGRNNHRGQENAHAHQDNC